MAKRRIGITAFILPEYYDAIERTVNREHKSKSKIIEELLGEALKKRGEKLP